MARRHRHFLPGATYHVMMRGNNGQSIFSKEEDRYKLCLLIQEGVERYGHSILAFCFMSNHIHLAIRLKDVSLSKICQNLAFRYTRFYNRQKKTIGHLFQGRFKSILVDSNCYLKELIRYIHLNPIRAKLVDNPMDYRWSSHQAYLMRQDFVWLNREDCLRKFGESLQDSVKAYNDFVLAGIGRDDGINFKTGSTDGILGDELFVEQMQEEIGNMEDNKLFEINLNTLNSVVTSWYNVDAEMLQTPGIDRKMAHIRAMAALLARKTVGVSLRELDVFFGRAEGSMSKCASRLERRMSSSNDLRVEFEKIQTELFLATNQNWKQIIS